MDIRPFQLDDEPAILALWDMCGLTRPWNDPRKDIVRKLRVDPEMFLVGVLDGTVVATVMAGYEGHRGWFNYLAVAPRYQRVGLGRRMVLEAERLLRLRGCPKINLQVRKENSEAIGFYRSLGYAVDEVVSMGKRLEDDAVRVRPETAADVDAISDLTRRAFAGLAYSDGTEPGIIDALRTAGALTLSFVAEMDGTIVGHVAFSPALPDDGSSGWYTLGPISVEPALQRRGIGSRLITDGLRTLESRNASGCIVLGDTRYYTRFGFVAAPDHAPAGEPKEYFMVRGLRSSIPRGTINFHDVFRHAGDEPR
jgi:predicted N-acetyltransferase YhbS